MRTHPDVPPDRTPGVLIVDPTLDDGGDFVHQMHANGWVVWVVADIASALATYALNADEIDVVLVDMQLPGLDGMRVMAGLREMNADLPCCATTAAVSPYAIAAFRRMCDTPLFTKPLNPRALSFTLTEMLIPVGKSWVLARA